MATPYSIHLTEAKTTLVKMVLKQGFYCNELLLLIKLITFVQPFCFCCYLLYEVFGDGIKICYVHVSATFFLFFINAFGFNIPYTDFLSFFFHKLLRWA